MTSAHGNDEPELLGQFVADFTLEISEDLARVRESAEYVPARGPRLFLVVGLLLYVATFVGWAFFFVRGGNDNWDTLNILLLSASIVSPLVAAAIVNRWRTGHWLASDL